jgi:hypothetical protein
MRVLSAIVFYFLCCITSNCQSVTGQQSKILAYNVISNGITAGIGSVINKPKNESVGSAFIKGAYRGAIGGVLTFTGKKLTVLIPRNAKTSIINERGSLSYNSNLNVNNELSSNSFAYGWIAKLVHSTGVSIITNASNHDTFLENWSTEVGFIRLNYNSINNSISARILLSRVYGFIKSEGNINWKKSLALGQFYFETSHDHYLKHGVDGKCIFCSVSVYKNSSANIVSHELIHSLQHSELTVLSSLTKASQEKLNKTKLGIINKIIFLEPYFINSAYKGVIKIASNNTYSRTINELEAFSLSTNKHVEKF